MSATTQATISDGWVDGWQFIGYGVLAVLFVLFLIAKSCAEKVHKDQFTEDCKAAGFTLEKPSKAKGKILAIDKGSRRIAIHTGRSGENQTKFYDGNQILSVSIFEDGHIALGGNAASSRASVKSKVSDITLRLELDDEDYPIHDHRLLDIPVNRGGWVHRMDSENARSLSSQISAIMRVPSRSSEILSQTQDVASQISMLAELHATGALNSEEFAAAKQHVLNGDKK